MTSPRPIYGLRTDLTYTPPWEACEGPDAPYGRLRVMRSPGAELLRATYRRGLRLRAGLVACALVLPRDDPAEDAREREVVAREVVARGTADRVAGARRAAGARDGVRAGAGRADG